MFRWVPYPFLRFTPALILGILTGLYLPVPFSMAGAALLFVLYVVFVVATPAPRKYQLATTTGILGLVTIAATGVVRIRQCDTAQQSTHLLQHLPSYSHYVATVTSDAERRTNSWRVTARLDYVLQRDSTGTLSLPTRLSANVLLYQSMKDSLHRLAYGDQIVVKGSLQPIAPPTNPHAFDVQQYWAQQQIHHQQYLRSDQWYPLGNHPPNQLVQLASSLRQRSREILTQAIVHRQAQGVALALVLGVKEQLEDQVREAYGRAGAMHILAVSGLHMGIVYGVVAFLLMPLRRIRWGQGWHALLCVAALWLFALVTGGSVSVLRAATMFTCIIVADATQRRANIFNTLALSAFLLLLINPYYLFSVGFQLSYLAVLGIVYLQPRLYRLIPCRYGWLDDLWALTAVSIAAQIATLPISLYYFHQFPTYFWLANVVVIPAATFILSLGLGTIAVGSVAPTLADWLGRIVEAIITSVNAVIIELERLPVSYVGQIHVDLPQVIGYYACIIAFIMLLHYRTFRYLVCGCWLLASTVALKVYRGWQQQQKSTITFYHLKGQSNVDFTLGRQNYHWGEWNEQAAYQIEPHHRQAGLITTLLDTTSLPHHIPTHKGHGITLAVWQQQRLAFVHSPVKRTRISSEKIPVDCVVVSNNAIRTLSALDHYFSYRMLIIDSSNSLRRAKKLADEAAGRAIPYHSVPAQGAFEMLL